MIDVSDLFNRSIPKKEVKFSAPHTRPPSNFPAVYPANCMSSTSVFKVEFRQRAPPNSTNEGSKVVYLLLTQSLVRKVFRAKPTANAFRRSEGRCPTDILNEVNDLLLCSIPMIL